MTRDDLLMMTALVRDVATKTEEEQYISTQPLIPAYAYNEHLDRVQTIWVPEGSKLKRWTPKKGWVEITATRYLHNEWEWLTVLIANYTKEFCYFKGEK